MNGLLQQIDFFRPKLCIVKL